MSKYKSQYKKEGDLSLVSLKLHNIGEEACESLHTWSGVREFYSIHTVVSGCGFYQVEDRIFSLNKGDSFLVYPEKRVRYWADEFHPWEYLWVGISGHSVKNIINHSKFSPETPIIREEDCVDLEKNLRKIYKAQGNTLQSELEMAGLTYVFLSKLIEENPDSAGKQRLLYAQRAKEFIELNYSRGILPHEVSEKLNISRSHLHRVFKEEFGVSTGKYIKKLQMDRAVELLLTTDLTIHEISCSVGHENQLYFSEVFRNYFGISPSGYRKDKKKT